MKPSDHWPSCPKYASEGVYYGLATDDDRRTAAHLWQVVQDEYRADAITDIAEALAEARAAHVCRTRAAAIQALRDLTDDLETASHTALSAGEREGLRTAARFARAKADAMSR